MDDNPRARSMFPRLRSPRSVVSQGNRSTQSLPATSPFMPEAASTPLASPDGRSGPLSRLFRKRPKGPSGTSSGSASPALTSESPSSRTPSFFKRLISTPKASATENRTAADSTPSLASLPAAVADLGPMPLESPHAVSQREAIPPKSPPEQAQEALERAGRLNARAADNIERVPGTWEAASSTAESWEGVISKISAFAGIVDAVGEVHPYLKAATSVIGGIVKPIVAQVARDKKFEELLEEMSLAYDHAIRNPSAVARLKDLPSNRQTSLLKAICHQSEQCALFIQNEYIKNFWERAAKNTLNGGDVDGTMEEYKSTFSDLRAKWQEELSHIENADKTIDKLRPMRDAGPSSQRACLQGTRTGVLEEIRQWIDDKDSPRVLFILGVAGSGKTALANTMAEIGEERRQLGSFFAFNRNDSTRIPERLLGTVAHNLAGWNETYRDWLSGILKAHPMLADSPDIMRQWQRLILEPAAAIPPSVPVLAVIDAFDECPEHADESRQRLLDCFTLRASDLPKSFRLLVTSRPLERVVQAVAAPSVRRLDLSNFPADEDIYVYVRNQIPRRNQGGLSDWDCHEIARAADGLFQWAATACRFLASKLGGTTMSAKFTANRERLFHGDPRRTQRPGGPPSLDELYSAVLEETFDALDKTVMANFRSVVALMLCAQTPLAINVLQSIYERALPSSYGVLQSILTRMGVVLEGVTSPSSPVRPMHLSFREFLIDASRSGPWHITEADIAHGHRILALDSLRIVSNHLSLTMHMHHLPLPDTAESETFYRRTASRAWHFDHYKPTYTTVWATGCGETIPVCPTASHDSMLSLQHHLNAMGWDTGSVMNNDGIHTAHLLYDKLCIWAEWSSVPNRFIAGMQTLRLVKQMLMADNLRFAQEAALSHISPSSRIDATL